MRELDVPYRVVVLPAGDISSAAAKTATTSIRFPSQGRYPRTGPFRTRPTSRRAGSASATAVSAASSRCTRSTARPSSSRMALAVLENFGGEVPEVLKRYGAPERVSR